MKHKSGCKFRGWSALVQADVRAALGVHSHACCGVKCDTLPADALAEVHVECVVDVAVGAG
jgi:hypothetical protein